uniref:Peptidase M13 C-terminal domain-containing protein n=1 Tax=Clastoptera arizonana TaxID=38151 RepID=A0A1B6DL18_9HEMI
MLNVFSAITLHTLLPFEDLTLPSYIIMAKLGFPLAHGIVQAFDTTGIKFKAGGLHEDIISPDSFDYYSRYYIFSNQFWFEYSRTIEDDKVYTYSINTLYTLNSRMSDISATKLLLETISHFGGMKEWLPYGNFTPHQTFHLSLLQEFCSKKTVPESIPELFESADLIELLRVNYIAANVEDFGIVFNCRNGSTLNPSERADSFPIFKIEELSPDYKEIVY